MPAISIITVTYNNLAGLLETARSVHAQSFRDFEWVIVDGASSDGTVEAFNEGKFAGARFTSEPDKGLYDAMNKGIDRATGDYLIFMNGGDAFADEKVLEDVAALGFFGTAPMIYGDAHEVAEGERLLKRALSHKTAAYTMFTHHQAIFYQRSAVGELRYDPSYRIGADWVFTGQMLQKSGEPERIEWAICDFERGGLSQTITPEIQRQVRKERRRALREVFGVREPVASLLLLGKAAVVAVRGRFPGLYDRWRMRRPN